MGLLVYMGDTDRDVRKSLFGDLEGRGKNPTACGAQLEGGIQETIRAIVDAEIVTNKSALESEMHNLRMKNLKKLLDTLETDRWMYDNDNVNDKE